MSETVKFSSKIDPEVLAKLRAYAKASGRSMASILTDAVAEHLARARVRPQFLEAAERVLDEHDELLRRLAR